MKLKFGALTFRPMPWLTIFTLVSVAILVSLGTWQYKRLHWKTDLLAQIEQAAKAQPLTDLAQIDVVLKAGEPLDFRRIELNGSFIAPSANDGQPYHLIRSDGKRYYWRLYQPYKDATGIAFVATREFAHGRKDTPAQALVGQVPVIGYVRMVQSANRFTPKSTPEENRWFAFNGARDTLDWADSVAGETIPTTYFIDQVIDAKSASDLPVRIPDVANNHLDYMLTWYSFVLILLVIYLILHKKTGRLYLERS